MAAQRYCTACRALTTPNTTCACGHPHGTALKTEHDTARWRRLQRMAIAAHPWCNQCGTTHNLTVHHLHYPARTMHDVDVLCRACHAHETNAPRA